MHLQEASAQACEPACETDKAAQQAASAELHSGDQTATGKAGPSCGTAPRESTSGANPGPVSGRNVASGGGKVGAQLKRPGDKHSKSTKNQKAQKLMSGFFAPSR